MVTYRGLPAPVISDFLSRQASRERYATGTEFHIGRIDMVANTGTYVDSPFHRFADGADLSELPLEALADLPAVVVRVSGAPGRDIGRSSLLPYEVAGKAVLVHTGWAAWWGTEQYFDDHPYLTGEAAEWLVENGAALVGIDSYNIDSTSGGERPAHTALLANGIPIVEHLRGLEQLPEVGARFTAVPVKVRGFGTFPVRAYASVPAEDADVPLGR
jgi:kynurenine formamidase